MSARLRYVNILGNLNAQVSFSHDEPSKCGFSDDIDTVLRLFMAGVTGKFDARKF